MGVWYCFMVEAKYGDKWFNIDHWCRCADGTMKHQYLLAAAERDLFSCDYDELAITKGPLRFCELAPTTQEIIRMRNPAFSRSSLDTFEFCLWGDVNDFERLLEKKVEEPEYPEITKAYLQSKAEILRNELQFFHRSILYERGETHREIETRIIVEYS